MDSILNVLSRATRTRKFLLLKMPSVGKCNFNSDWVLDGAYENWFHAVKGDKHPVYCKLCCQEFKLVRMGKAALTSQMEGARHQRCTRDSSKSVPNVKSFASVKEHLSWLPQLLEKNSVMECTGEGRTAQSLSDFCTLSKKFANAEILWPLKCVS